jgi:hypothetical protein
MNGEHDEPAPTESPSAIYLASLTDEHLTIIATDRLHVWTALLDATEFDAAEGLEHFIGEIHAEVERRLTVMRAQRRALALLLTTPEGSQ